MRETMKEVGHLGPAKTQLAFLKKARRRRREVYKRHGCGDFLIWRASLVQLPVFLASIEALRIMCGTNSGLLGLMVESITGGEAAGLEERLGKSWFEPGLTTEGALWFKDLTVADPDMTLPFMLSGSMILNLIGGKKVPYAVVKQAIWQTRMNRILLTMAVLAGPLLLHVPSGVLVYWISSMLMAAGQATLLDIFMPRKKPIGPCEPRRPLRIGRAMKDNMP